MATTKNLPILKIHTLTEVQYNTERDANRLEEDAFYLTPYEEVKVVSDLSSDSTTDALSAAAGKSLQDNKANKLDVYTKNEINKLLNDVAGGSSESAESVSRALNAYIQYTDTELYGAEKVEKWNETGTYNPQYSETSSRIDALVGHTHNYAGSSTAGGAANSVKASLAIRLNSGVAEGVSLFTFNGSTAKAIDITPSAIGAAPTSHASTTQDYGVASASNYGHAKATGTTPKALGTTANIGTETTSFARGDHIHPLPALGDCTGVLSVGKGGLGKELKDFGIGNAILYARAVPDTATPHEVAALRCTDMTGGALYTTSQYGAPKFGTLPIAQGGTGADDWYTAQYNLNLRRTAYPGRTGLGNTEISLVQGAVYTLIVVFNWNGLKTISSVPYFFDGTVDDVILNIPVTSRAGLTSQKDVVQLTLAQNANGAKFESIEACGCPSTYVYIV